MASSQGRATVAPKAPRMNVRRERCFFVMIIGIFFRLKADTTPYLATRVVVGSASRRVRIWNGALSTIPLIIDCSE